MQEQVSEKIVALVIRLNVKGAKLTEQELKKAMRAFLNACNKKRKQKTANKESPKSQRGKQTIKQLMNQNQGLTNIEVTDKNIKSFERVANKYNIDFALKKDKYAELPRYLVFFKARDMDVMQAAFKEYSAKEITKLKKPSIQKRLSQYIQKSKVQDKQRERSKQKDRGQER